MKYPKLTEKERKNLLKWKFGKTTKILDIKKKYKIIDQEIIPAK